MSWQIGDIGLPVAPYSITWQRIKTVKKVPVYIEDPWLFDYGPDTAALKLQGYLVEDGKDIDEIATDYVIPLRALTSGRMAFRRLISDDNAVSDSIWSSIAWGSGSVGTPGIVDSTTQVAVGVNSARITTGSAAGEWSGVRSTLNGIDVTPYNFISTWIYISSAPKTFTVRIGTDTSNTYYSNFIINNIGWTRTISRISSQFQKVGSPNWTDVDYLWVATNSPHVWYLDRTCLGVGYELNAPGIRYDGLYLIQQLQITEDKNIKNAFNYTMTLWDTDTIY